MQFKRLNHCVYHYQYHIILTSKYRRKIFNEGIFTYFQIKLTEIKKHYPLIECKISNQDKDHIHILTSIPPTMSVGSVVRIIKSNTSKLLKQKFPFLKEVYWGTEVIWSESYFASTIGINEKVIKQYIKQQDKEDSGQAKLELG